MCFNSSKPMLKDVDQDGVTPPSMQPQPTAPAAGATPGAAPTASGMAGQPSPEGFSGFAKPGPWGGVPFNQTYGGQPAPYDNLHTQILNTLRMGDAGAGRFTGNAAARYGFQGGNQAWRPDANPWNQPIPQYGYQPQNPFPQQPQGGFGGQSQGGGMAPKVSAGAGFDPAAAFKTLMAEDPTLAFQATNTGSMQNWYMQNKDKPGFLQQFGYQGDLNSFANQGSPQGGNTSYTPDRVNRLMALGIR